MYNIIIVGGGAAGCSAAYNFAKYGFKTLLIEKNTYLGGLMTGGLVSPAMKTSTNSINNDFLNDFKSELKALNAVITYEDGNDLWFNPELAKIALDTLMSKTNVEVLLDTTVTDVIHKNNAIKGVTVNNGILSEYIETRYIVDATGNCEISKILNCNFINKKDEQQPTNLRFIMSGINLKEFSEWLLDFDDNREVTTSCLVNGEIHLSTAYTWDEGSNWALKPLFDDAVEAGILKNEDRNYFQVFTIPNMPNSIGFNAPRIHFDKAINPINTKEATMALKLGREAIYRLTNFCKIYFPGFENAYLSNIADMLGVRVSRRILGKYIYTIDDLTSGKKFDNPVVISNYPVDVHSTNNNSVLNKVDVEYQLPVESLMSADFNNLYVVGRCLSADFYAQGALRIIPSCMSMGEGLAKYLLEHEPC